MNTKKKSKRGIQRKVTLLICCFALVVALSGAVAAYFYGKTLITKILVDQRLLEVKVLVAALERIIHEELEDLRVYSRSTSWKEEIRQANKGYVSLKSDEIEQLLIEKDSTWKHSENEEVFAMQLATPLAQELKEIAASDTRIAELFITDQYGGLVASSDKTSDFYQADERWWQAAFSDGAGSNYIGNVEFDESAGVFSLPLAVPIFDSNRKVIGACKGVLNLSSVISILSDFRAGTTGHASLVDEQGTVIFHQNVTPLTQKILPENLIPRILGQENGWLIADPRAHSEEKDKFIPHHEKILMVFARSRLSPVQEDGPILFVVFAQDSREAFIPLTKYIANLLFVLFLLIMLIIPLGYVFGSIFSKPIHELHMATEKILEGNWNYSLDIHTRDEIEQFSETFQEMISQIKSKQNILLQTQKELEELSKHLEEKVTDRTRELTRTQEATMNILEDLTEVKKKLELALAIKSDFTSMVSHELRTPLTAIKEGIAIVLDGTTGTLSPEQTEFLNLAKRNVERLTRLINSVLDFQKLDSGKMSFVFQEHDINEVAREVYASMEPMAKAKGIGLFLKLGEHIPRIEFDRDKIIQVITNLLSNALKFTEKGQVTVATICKNNIVEVSVSDTGPGIKAEDITKLFQQFVQLHNSGERSKGSSGLGLAISKKIIESHRGKIWVESVSGSGSVFYFVLPIQERRV